jgi:hypothetical protein
VERDGPQDDGYLSANPEGTVCSRNDAGFRETFAPWRRRFEALGFRSASIRHLETTSLDAHVAFARVGWRMRFERDAAPMDADFDESHVLLQRDGDAVPRIVCSSSHRTEAHTLRAAGMP